MKPGRKRKAKPITLPGRVTLAAIERAEKAQRMAETITVLQQPHRRGSNATECASALGRFWLAHKFDRVMLQAGEEYGAVVRRWRAVWGLKDASVAADGASTGLGPSAATVRSWRATIDRVENRLVRASPEIRFAINRLCLDDRDISAHAIDDAKAGLRIIANELGLVGPNHPFHGSAR